MTTFPQVLSRAARARRRAARSSPSTTTRPASGPSCRSRRTPTGWPRWRRCSSTSSSSSTAVACWSTCPTHWLAPVVLGAAWAGGLEVVWDGRGRRRGHRTGRCGPLGPRRRRASPSSRARSSRSPGASLTPLPAGVHDLGVEVWSQPDAYVAWPAPADDDPAVAGLHPGRAVESGRRRESDHRRRPPPLGDESGFPFRSRFLHRTAGSQRFHGPDRPHVRGATRADRGRRARHSTLRPRSARQVVASQSLAEIQRREEALRRALEGVDAAGVALPHDQVGMAGQATGR